MVSNPTIVDWNTTRITKPKTKSSTLTKKRNVVEGLFVFLNIIDRIDFVLLLPRVPTAFQLGKAYTLYLEISLYTARPTMKTVTAIVPAILDVGIGSSSSDDDDDW